MEKQENKKVSLDSEITNVVEDKHQPVESYNDKEEEIEICESADRKKRFIARKRRDIEDEVNPNDIHIEENKNQTQTPKLGSIIESSPHHIHKESLEEFSSGSIQRIIPNTENKSIAEINNRYDNNPIDNNEVNLN
jgi:hypothetical protein